MFSIIPKFFLQLLASLELTPGITLLFKPFSLFGAVLVQKQMNLEQTNKYWKVKEQQYSGDKISLWPYSLWNYFIGLENKHFLDKALKTVKEGDSVLDFGCGTGRVAEMIVERTKNITLLDFSSRSMGICLSRLARLRVKPSYHIGSFADFTYGTNTYDYIISVVSLSFLTEKDVYLSTLRSLLNSLKDDGTLVLMERFGLYSTDVPIIKVKCEEIIEYVEAEGFKVVEKHVVDSTKLRLVYFFLEKVKNHLNRTSRLLGIPILILQVCFLPMLYIFEMYFPEKYKKDSNYTNLMIKRVK